MNIIAIRMLDLLAKTTTKAPSGGANSVSLTAGTCDSNLQAIVNVAKFVLTAIQWLVPILLILWGTIDLVKAVVAGKEEDIKKNQKILIKRLISAVIVFLLPVAVSIIMGLIGSKDWQACWKDAEATIDLNELNTD